MENGVLEVFISYYTLIAIYIAVLNASILTPMHSHAPNLCNHNLYTMWFHACVHVLLIAAYMQAMEIV